MVNAIGFISMQGVCQIIKDEITECYSCNETETGDFKFGLVTGKDVVISYETIKELRDKINNSFVTINQEISDQLETT